MKGIDYLHILCPPWGFDTPPLGPAYVMESLRAYGFKARFVDISALLLREIKARPHLKESVVAISGISDMERLWAYSSLQVWHHLRRFEELFNALWPAVQELIEPYLQPLPDALGFSVYRDNLRFSAQTASALRERLSDTPIIFGGPWVKKGFDREAMATGVADLLVFGEAEEIFPRILKDILAEPRRGRRKVLEGMAADGITAYPVNVNSVPYPRYEGFDFDLYRYAHACAMTARGCPKRCSFCIDWILGRRYRERDVSNVLDEIEFLSKERGIKVLIFNDLNLGVNVERLRAIARGIIDRGIDLIWDANLSVSEELDEATLELLKRSGARTLQFGIESGSSKILKLMGKDYTPQLARTVLKSAHKVGLKTMINLIVGYPNETEADFEETVRFLNDVAEYIDSIGAINTLHIVPLTNLARQCDRLNIRPVYGNEPVEHDWKQENLDINTRIERAYRLIAAARKHGLGMIQTNADIDRLEFRRGADRDIFEALPLSVSSGRLERIRIADYELRSEREGESIRLRLNPNYSAIKSGGKLIELGGEGEAKGRIAVQSRRLVFMRPVGGMLAELDFRSKPTDEMEFLIEQRLPESIDVEMKSIGKPSTAVVVKVLGKSVFRTLTARHGDLSIELTNGLVKIYRQGRLATSFPHLYFDVDTAGGKRLRSFDGRWFYRHRAEKGILKASVTWDDVDFRFSSEFDLAGGCINWRLYLESGADVSLGRFKAGISLAEDYRTVGTDAEKFDLKKAEFGSWVVVGPRDGVGRLPLDDGYSGSAEFLFAESESAELPRIEVRPANPSAYLPVIQNGCEIGPSLGLYARDVTFKAGKVLVLAMKVDVLGNM